MIREHIYFSGVVQGVGFRFRAKMIAEDLKLTGWCRNLYDGRVECEVQGRKHAIEQFIIRIQNERFIEITNVVREAEPVKKGEAGFRITY